MDGLSIELKNGRNALAELYYVDGKGSIFLYEKTKRLIRFMIISAIFSIIFYLLSFNNEIIWIFLFVLCSLVFLICLILLIYKGNQYFQWKKNVDYFLKKTSQYNTQFLKLTLECIELTNKDETFIEKWDNIKHASIVATHITLTSATQVKYLFPAKSMEPTQYIELKQFIRMKMNNQSIIEDIEKIPKEEQSKRIELGP